MPSSRTMPARIASAFAILGLILGFAWPALHAQALPDSPQSSAASRESGYARSLSSPDFDPQGSSVGWGTLTKNAAVDGSPLSLLVEGEERVFDEGLFAHAPSIIHYTDIQDFGYERFESWVGIGSGAREPGMSARVVFKVIGDGEVLWQSSEMTERSDAEFVSIDISNVSVLQLKAEAVDKASAPNNHAVWADATFSKESATPWLIASDKTFAIPDQVTPENILEGVFARTLSGEVGETVQPVEGNGTLRNGKEGNDLSDLVTYTTDYVPGATGTFSITYSVTDAQGLTRTRTQSMTVEGTERVRLNADLDFLTTPFASFMYAGRDYFDEQGKRAFDYCLEALLSFGENPEQYPIVYKNGEDVYKVTVNLQAAGIYLQTSDAKYFTPTLMDDEPRCFHLKDWGTEYTTVDGMVGTMSFYVPRRYGQRDAQGQVYYHTRLLQVEKNASTFLAAAEEEMTDAQRLRAVLYPYGDWISYEGGGQVMDEALADGKSVCGGNARGSIYLSQRIGIKAYWVRTGSHAWSNVKLNHDDSENPDGSYYRIDLLARPGCFLSIDADHEGFRGHHNQVRFNRAKGYPDMVTKSYPFAWSAWPNVTLSANESIRIIAPTDAFDPLELLTQATSIYDGDLSESVEVDDGGLAASRDENGYAPGLYTMTYRVTDSHGNSRETTAHVQVLASDVVDLTASNVDSAGGSEFGAVSLWNGRQEVPYDRGILQKEAKSATFDIAGKGYTYFDAWVGINGSVRQNTSYGMNGKVQLEVWAELEGADGSTTSVNLYTSPVLGWYATQVHVLVSIPENVRTLTLKNTPCGSGNNHAAWGSPRLLTEEALTELPDAPVITGVENGAVYHGPVTPCVEGAETVTLYRSELAATLASGAARAAAPEGKVVDSYVPGTPISEDGAYTLVAANTYGQMTSASFSIVLDDDGGVGDESQVGNAGASGNGANGDSDTDNGSSTDAATNQGAAGTADAEHALEEHVRATTSDASSLLNTSDPSSLPLPAALLAIGTALIAAGAYHRHLHRAQG